MQGWGQGSLRQDPGLEEWYWDDLVGRRARNKARNEQCRAQQEETAWAKGGLMCKETVGMKF